MQGRYTAIARVLVRVFVLNLGVAVAKIGFGYFSGAVSVLSDGFHSLIDASSNVVGLIGIRAASQPPDADHPYGHRKFETVASGAFVGFTALVMLEVLRNAFNHFVGKTPAHAITTASFVVMVVTVAVNLVVIWYESREAKRLSSEMLAADAMQTRADVWSSLTVIAALAGTRLGWPILDPLGALIVALAGTRLGWDILDPIAALVVAAFIGYGGWTIFHATTGILSDRVVMQDTDVEHVVMSVPGVLGCHQIRTRGSEDHVFLDLHVWLPPEMPLVEAHDISHVVKDKLMARYPNIADAIIHIEPPPRA